MNRLPRSLCVKDEVAAPAALPSHPREDRPAVLQVGNALPFALCIVLCAPTRVAIAVGGWSAESETPGNGGDWYGGRRKSLEGTRRQISQLGTFTSSVERQS